jgi:hypothetical protein
MNTVRAVGALRGKQQTLSERLSQAHSALQRQQQAWIRALHLSRLANEAACLPGGAAQ